MFHNYFKTSFRSLLKRKGYSVLNILGLSIGITCCLLIFQYVSYERSYENFNKNADDIVRLRLDNYKQGKLQWQSATSYPAIAPAMKKDFPEVEDYCRLIDAEELLTNDENKVKFYETKGYFADASSINMLDINLTKGDKNTALTGPDKIILSEAMAKKYFGSENAIGKRLSSNGNGNKGRILEVTGVFKDYPANSHLMLNYLISYVTKQQINNLHGDKDNSTETSFGWYDFYTYLKLRPGTDLKKFAAKFPAFCDRYMNNMEWLKNNNVRCELYLLPLKDIHLYPNYNQEAEVNGNGKAVGFLYLIAFIIIVIAWVNYINLSTARSVERAKEVGMRKVLGALRINLIGQFMIESIIFNIIGFTIALIAAFLLTPGFNLLSGRAGNIPFFIEQKYWLVFITMFVAGSFFSGLYPAFVLSSFKPIKVLKGVFRNTTSGQLLRKGLIVMQFAVSVILIAGTIIVYRQVSFMRKQQLGANINQTLVLSGAKSLRDSAYRTAFQPFKNELLQQTSIKSVAASSNVMGQEILWTSSFKREGNYGVNTLYILGTDEDFLNAYNIKLIAGRGFDKSFGTNKGSILLNERAVTLLGFKNADEAINSTVLRGGTDTLTVTGVIADYHHQGLQKGIDPQIFLYTPYTSENYSLKVSTTNIQQTIASVKKLWGKYFPSDPFDYFFLDTFFDQQYKADDQFGKIFGLFSFLAIAIACFGLLGLSAYNVVQRTKEIGIRKVLGASVHSIVVLLSKEFVVLISVAFVLAVPVSWWVMNNWLSDFAYRINISWWIFLIAGATSFLVALFTISFQAMKAALTNPVKSLRTE